MSSEDYVLVTSARNEAAYIGQTLDSVARQTVLPAKWVIVSDASTDGTDNIVTGSAEKREYIELLRRDEGERRDFSSKVRAIGEALEHLCDVDYSFVGILDADIVLDADYYGRLLSEFRRDPKLGLAGGSIRELHNGAYLARPINRERTVPGAIQLFRRTCFEDIGGFLPLPLGGEDLVAGIMARMHGWRVSSFEDLPAKHLRLTGGAGGSRLATGFRQGRMDRAMGYHPLYEVCKFVRRLAEKPFLVSSCSRLAGYCRSALRGEEICVPPDVVRFMRDEQLATLRLLPRHTRRGESR